MLNLRDRRCSRALGLVAAASTVAVVAVAPAAATPSPAAPSAYVTVGSGFVTIDGKTFDQAGSGSADATSDIVLSANGRTVYLTSGRNVVTIDARTLEAVAQIADVAPAGQSLRSIALSPDGQSLYTTDGTKLYVIDLAEQKVAATVDARAGSGIAAAPDGTRVYVGDADNDAQLSVIDTKTHTVGKTVSLKASNDISASLEAFAMAPDGKTIYALVEHDGPSTFTITVDAVDTRTYRVSPTATVTTTPGVSDFRFGTLAVAPDGRRIYVGAGQLDLIDLTTTSARVTKVLDKTTASVQSLSFTPDARTLYAAEWCDGCAPAGAIDVVDVRGGKLRKHIDLDRGARATAVAPDQAPVARLRVTAAPTNRSTRFDASASTVQFGTIASYRWDFGDGSAAVTTSTPAVSHTYSRAGHFAARVTETSSAGTSTTTVFTGRMMLRDGSPSATTAVPVSITAATAPSHSGAGGSATPSHPALASTGPSGTGRNVAIALACLIAGSGLLFLGRRRYLARHR